MAVGGRCKSQIGQCKDSTSLADAAAIEVHRFYFHTGFGIAIACFKQFYTCIYGECIALKEFVDCHPSYKLSSDERFIRSG